MSIFYEQYYNTGIGDTPHAYGGEELGFFEAMSSAYNSQVRGSNIDTYVELMKEELQPVIDSIQEKEGQTFINPGNYFGASDSQGHNDRRREYQLNQVFDHLNANRELYPEFESLTRDSLHQKITSTALEEIQAGRESAERETTLGAVGGFVGIAGGVFSDDAFLEQLFMMGPTAFTRSSANLGQTMVREAIIGAGMEAQLQAGVMDWYNSLGLDYGYDQFLTNVAAGLFIGGALPPVLKGGSTAVSLTFDQAKRGIEAFKGTSIKPRDGDLAMDQLDDLEALSSPDAPEVTAPQDEFVAVINKYNQEETFLADSPEFVRPVKTPSETLADEVEIFNLKSQQPFETLDELYELAPVVQAKLENAGRRIEAQLGAKFKTPGVKLKETSAEKLGRKGYSSAKELADVVRAGFVAKTGKQADEIVAALKKEFDLVDEGWGITPDGYFDRKVLIKNDDGVLGEVQIWSENILKAKDVGHKLYKESIATKSKAKKKKLRKQQIEVYTEALAKEHQSFANLSGILKDPNLSSKIALKSSSPPAITRADVNTSPASTGTQSPPGSTMASAFNPSESTIAGRPSQEVNTKSDMGSPSTSNIVDEEFNVEDFITRQMKADDAFANLERGNLPDDPVGSTQTRPAPQETAIQAKDVDDAVEQVSRDTDFENMADDEILVLDEVIDDQVVARSYTGAEIKAELAQDQQMLDRLRGCVV